MGEKRGFTLIELILMVIVMGIAFATLPAILGVSARSVENVSDVRGIYHGAAKMQVVLSKPWDEGNVDDFGLSGIYYVLRSAESDMPGDALYCDNNKTRQGHYPGLDRRMCDQNPASNSATAAFGLETGETVADDLDDFDGDSDNDIEGYKVGTTVSYVDYVSAAVVTMPQPQSHATTNIKHIIVRVHTPSGRLLTDYHYYAANIGISKPFIKDNN